MTYYHNTRYDAVKPTIAALEKQFRLSPQISPISERIISDFMTGLHALSFLKICSRTTRLYSSDPVSMIE